MTVVKLTTIGDRLKYARTCRNLSQRQVAERIGVNQKTVSNLENNANYSTYTLHKLAQVLCCDFSWVRHGVGDAPEQIPRPTKRMSYKEEIERLNAVITEMNHLLTSHGKTIERLTDIVDRLTADQTSRS